MAKIRTAKSEEITEIVRIYKTCNIYSESISNETVVRRCYERNPDMFLVAEEDDKVVGTIHGQSDGIFGFVWKLAVLPGYQRRGIAKTLMKEIMKRLREDGCVGANLLVRADNTNVIDFYEKQGWEKWKHQLMVFPDLTKIEKHYE